MPSSLLLRDDVLKQTFGLFDVDGTGQLDFDSFALALKALGVWATPEEATDLYKKVKGQDSKAPVTLKEFQKAVAAWDAEVTQEAEAARMFGQFTKGKDVSEEDFVAVHERIGWNPDTDRITRFVKDSSAEFGGKGVDEAVWTYVILGGGKNGGKPEEEIEEY